MQISDEKGHLLCITKTGIYKSPDSGVSWTLKSVNRDFRDLEMKPNNSSIWFATNWTGSSRGSYLFVSLDKGETWELRNFFNGLYPDTRWEIEISKADPNKLYLLGGNRMYYSENDGDSMKLMHDGGDHFNPFLCIIVEHKKGLLFYDKVII